LYWLRNVVFFTSLRSLPLRFISDLFRILFVLHLFCSVCFFVRSVPLRFGAFALR